MFVIFDDWDRLPGAMVEIWAEGTLVRIGVSGNFKLTGDGKTD